MALLCALVTWYYRRIWTAGSLSAADRIGLGTLVLFWLAAGLYNPLLLNPIASIIYASLATLSALGNEDKFDETAPEPRYKAAPKFKRLRFQWRNGTQALG
jgi:hypothetical protein